MGVPLDADELLLAEEGDETAIERGYGRRRVGDDEDRYIAPNNLVLAFPTSLLFLASSSMYDSAPCSFRLTVQSDRWHKNSEVSLS